MENIDVAAVCALQEELLCVTQIPHAEDLINDSIPISLWESEDLLEDYWSASTADKIKIVVRRGIDPRVSLDYERISALSQLAGAGNAAQAGSGEAAGLNAERRAFVDRVKAWDDDTFHRVVAVIDAVLGEKQ